MVSKKQWDIYQKAKKSKSINMYNLNEVRQKTNLSYEVIKEIMEQYDLLLKRFDKDKWIEYHKKGIVENQ
jgi:hypothetical protein